MKRRNAALAARLMVMLALATALLTACDGGDSDKTPPPTATWTPAPTNAVSLPAVDSGSQSGGQVSPLATPDLVSPLATPAPTP